MALADLSEAQEMINTRHGIAYAARGRRHFIRMFKVWTTNLKYGPNEICQAVGLPQPYEPYVTADGQDSDLAAVCISLDANLVEPTDNRLHWIVTAVYSTDVPEEGPAANAGLGNDPLGSSSNPWDEPPVIKWESEVIQRAPAFDLNGTPFLNAAGQPFTPAPTFETGRAIYVITRNEQNFSRQAQSAYAFSVNNADFMDAPAGTVQCLPILAEYLFRGSIPYWRTTYRLRFGAVKGDGSNLNNLESWQPEILNSGFMQMQLDPTLPQYLKPVAIIGTNGAPITQPVLLDLAGLQTDTPEYIQFRMCQSRDFSPILTTGVGILH